METVNIRNVDVDFPFKPYDCQVAYMNKVIECLQEGKNGILESPTGTGKTLCLLCATLAWRQTVLANKQLQQGVCSNMGGNADFKSALGSQLQQGTSGTWDASCNNKGSNFEIPKIIYASRTHSQLSQAVQELKATVYRPKVSIIGSREQLCVNSDVLKQESNSAKQVAHRIFVVFPSVTANFVFQVHMCRAKVVARTCNFYNNLEANKSNPEFTNDILDIEDLAGLGRKHNVCPYYMARELKTTADIIFMPYNYLLDSKSRKAHNLDISGSIVVFDEAHNLEKICEDTVSFDLTSFDIASCIEDTLQCMEYISMTANDDSDTGEGANTSDVHIEDLQLLKALLSKLEEEIENIELLKDGSKSFPGKVNINSETKDNVLEILEKVNALLASDTRGIRGKHFALQKFSDALQTVFNRSSPSAESKTENDSCSNSTSFKVHIQLEPDSKKKQKCLDIWKTGTKVAKKGRTLSYWCFSPGHAMRDLVAHGVHCVLLTSGTLSPLASFTAEMQIPFPIRLENPHVIEKHQMWVGVVTKAPDGATLNSSFEFRSTTEYMTGLGNTIANFARTVPNGLLVFFPSYPVMNKCIEHWQSTGIWARLAHHKPMFTEPKGKGDFIQIMNEFYSKINDPELNGATFFAVCRGKVSEGLDFTDINGRAVVITGLPFPPKLDPKIKLKMSFLDEMLRKDKGSFKSLTGRDWYRQQASRAVNQAIGRVIRHKQDYGAILLCDIRFTYSDAIRQLPSWVRPHVKVFREFGYVQRELIQFFRTADKLVDKSAMKVKKQNSQASSDKCDSPCGSGEKHIAPMFRARRSVETPRRRERSALPAPTREAPVTLSRLSIEYETTPTQSSSVAAAPSRPQARLLNSLEISEVAQKAGSSDTSTQQALPTLSDTIMRKRNVKNQHKTKKLFKVVKSKDENVEERDNPMLQRLEAAKSYIVKVKQALSEDNYKKFSRILSSYKQSKDMDDLICGLTPIFTRNASMYPLFLDFSNYVRDPVDKKKLFEAYREITGEAVPVSYLVELKSRKRTAPESEQSCKVGKKLKVAEDESKITKSSCKEKRLSLSAQQ